MSDPDPRLEQALVAPLPEAAELLEEVYETLSRELAALDDA